MVITSAALAEQIQYRTLLVLRFGPVPVPMLAQHRMQKVGEVTPVTAHMQAELFWKSCALSTVIHNNSYRMVATLWQLAAVR